MSVTAAAAPGTTPAIDNGSAGTAPGAASPSPTAEATVAANAALLGDTGGAGITAAPASGPTTLANGPDVAAPSGNSPDAWTQAKINHDATLVGDETAPFNERAYALFNLVGQAEMEGVPGNANGEIIDYPNLRFLKNQGVPPEEIPTFLRDHGLNGHAHWRSFPRDYEEAMRANAPAASGDDSFENMPVVQTNRGILAEKGLANPNTQDAFMNDNGLNRLTDPNYFSYEASLARAYPISENNRSFLEGQKLDDLHRRVAFLRLSGIDGTLPPEQFQENFRDFFRVEAQAPGEDGKRAQMVSEGRSSAHLWNVLRRSDETWHDILRARAESPSYPIVANSTPLAPSSPGSTPVRWEISELESGTAIHDRYTGREYRFNRKLGKDERDRFFSGYETAVPQDKQVLTERRWIIHVDGHPSDQGVMGTVVVDTATGVSHTFDHILTFEDIQRHFQERTFERT